MFRHHKIQKNTCERPRRLASEKNKNYDVFLKRKTSISNEIISDIGSRAGVTNKGKSNDAETGLDTNNFIEDKLNHSSDTPNDLQTSSSESDTEFQHNQQITLQDNKLTEDTSMKIKLAQWAVENGITHVSLNKLLRILNDDGKYKLPLDARTLLRTPRYVSNVREMGSGQYIHLGLRNYLEMFVADYQHKLIKNEIVLSFSVDGTPLSKSGSTDLWPIFGCIHTGEAQRNIFIVGIYAGPGKPKSANQFLNEFVDELLDITNHNKICYNDVIYSVKTKLIIADAPALAYIKGVKSHGGYFACTKCEAKGTYHSLSKNVVYTELNAPRRSDLSFRERKSRCEDDDHFTSIEHSCLEKLSIDMISDFPLDKMHLVDEGICKKILLKFTGKANPQKLPAAKLIAINNHINKCALYIPMEFQRKTRNLKYVLRMKATELRNFLLYIGPITLKSADISKSTYNHFVSLSLAIRILTSPLYYIEYNAYANNLLLEVVKQFSKLYGVSSVTYNTHGLIHLAEDARKHGPLDSYSCYAFENYIRVLKKMLRGKNLPLQQLHNRLHERIQAEEKITISNSLVGPELSHKHDNTNNCTTATFSNFCIMADKISDNCVMLENKTIVRVKHFVNNNGQQYLYGNEFAGTNPLNDHETFSVFHMLTGYFEIKLSKHPLESVICKMCCLPSDSNSSEYFVSPLNHTLTKYNNN